jgi:hypothetical protein
MRILFFFNVQSDRKFNVGCGGTKIWRGNRLRR